MKNQIIFSLHSFIQMNHHIYKIQKAYIYINYSINLHDACPFILNDVFYNILG
jgi:hypothetical protein